MKTNRERTPTARARARARAPVCTNIKKQKALLPALGKKGEREERNMRADGRGKRLLFTPSHRVANPCEFRHPVYN